MVPIAIQRQLSRWYALKDHPVQLSLVKAVADGVRFPLVPAGRRSGKTERFKRFLSKQAMKNSNELYFAAAPTRDQVKKIFWDDLKAFTLSAMHKKTPSESELKIYMDNGTEIHLIGLDKPARIEGIPWTGGGIDEIADIKPNAWGAHIYPALNTVNPTRPDHRAWCWLLGVPDGLNHYYEMCQLAETGGDPDYKVFHWKSAEILPPDVIDAARRTLSAKQFKQEYEASFETASGRVYEDYSTENSTDEVIKDHEQLLWCHDFNYTPMSSAVCVVREKDIYALDEIVLDSAVAKQSAMEFVDKYKDHKNKHVLIYGDPAGKAGEKHGHKSDYIEMERVLTANDWTFTRKVKKAAPAIKDRQNQLRAKIKSASGEVSLYVNTKLAPYSHKGLATTQLKEGSTFQEAESRYQHITTALGYFVNVEFPITQPKSRPRYV